MYLDRKFGLSLSLSEMTLLFDLSLYLDRTLAQRKAKSKVKVAQCFTFISHNSSSPTISKAYDTSESFLRKSLAQVTFARKLAHVTFTIAP